MKIVVVMSLASPWARDAATTLHSLGHDVQVVDFATPPGVPTYLGAADAIQRDEVSALQSRGIGVHRMNTRWSSTLRYLSSAPELRRIARTVGADVVLALYGGGHAMLAWASGVRPYAVFVVGSDVLLAGGLVRRVSAHVLEQAGAVFANGKYLGSQTALLAPRARVSTLYLGVNVSDFALAPQQVANPRIVCTRGFLPVYNNRYLIEGLAGRGHERAPVPTTFVSKGPELGDVQALADRILSPEQRAEVSFLGGVELARLRTALATSQIYVSLSVSDGTSISLLEALASGLFPILSDIPQNREWIDSSGSNGILVPLDDPKALTAAIDRATRDEGLRVQASAINRRLVCERADARTNIAFLADRLQTLIAQPRRDSV